jgi:hypothetical protein
MPRSKSPKRKPRSKSRTSSPEDGVLWNKTRSLSSKRKLNNLLKKTNSPYYHMAVRSPKRKSPTRRKSRSPKRKSPTRRKTKSRSPSRKRYPQVYPNTSLLWKNTRSPENIKRLNNILQETNSPYYYQYTNGSPPQNTQPFDIPNFENAVSISSPIQRPVSAPARISFAQPLNQPLYSPSVSSNRLYNNFNPNVSTQTDTPYNNAFVQTNDFGNTFPSPPPNYDYNPYVLQPTGSPDDVNLIQF